MVSLFLETASYASSSLENLLLTLAQESINFVATASHRLVLESYHPPEHRQMILVPGGRNKPPFNTPELSSDDLFHFAQRYQRRTQLQQQLLIVVGKSDGFFSLITRARRSSYSLPHVSHDQSSIPDDQTINDLLYSILSLFPIFPNQSFATTSREAAYWLSEMNPTYTQELASSALSEMQPNATRLQSQEPPSSLSEMELDETPPRSQELSSSLFKTAQGQTLTPCRGPSSLFSGMEFDQTSTRAQEPISYVFEMADSLTDDIPATQLQAFTSSPLQVPIAPNCRTSMESIQGTADARLEVPSGQNQIQSKAFASSRSLLQMPITPNDRNPMASTGGPANTQQYVSFDPNPPQFSSASGGEEDIWSLLEPNSVLSGQAPANVQLQFPFDQSPTSQSPAPLFRSVPIEFRGRLLSQGSSPAEPPPPQNTTFPRPSFFQYPINHRLYNAFIAQQSTATLPRFPEPERYDFEALALRHNEKLKKASNYLLSRSLQILRSRLKT